jgi:hypothetical protein
MGGNLRAQEARAHVQGVVMDSSGAAIPAATATLVNIQTGVKMVRSGNETGAYRFDYVDPGTYNLTIEASGFGRFSQENFEIMAMGDVTVDATLKTGGVTESVTVSGNVVELQFNTANDSLTLDTKITSDLPRFDRNPFKLSELMPSAVETRRNEMNPYNSWAPNSVNLGGSTTLKNDLEVDGSPIGIGYKAAFVPNPGAVEETSVEKNAVDAGTGHSAGGTITLATKPGTNELHGDAFELNRNPVYQAMTDRTTGTKAYTRNNIYGADVGHRIIKNKLFNFASWESQTIRAQSSTLYTVATTLEQQGNFSQSKNTAGGLRTIYDPWTTVFNATTGTATRTPFPGNAIPQNRWDPVGARWLQAMSAFPPNRTPDSITGTNNYAGPIAVTHTDYYDISDRVDWYATDKWRIFGRPSFYRTNLPVSPPGNFTTAPATDIYHYGGSRRKGNVYGGQAIWTVNATTVVDFRADYHSFVDLSYTNNENTYNPFTTFWPNNPWYTQYLYAKGVYPNYAPGILIEGASTWGSGSGVLWNQQPNGQSASTHISQQRGKHFLKAGLEFRHLGGHLVTITGNQFNFTNAMTANTFLSPNTALSGDAFATLLLGAIDNTVSGSTSNGPTTSLFYKAPYQQNRESEWSSFIQDDFKLTRNITVSLGLRWEYETPWHDPLNQESVGPDFTVPSPNVGANPPQMPASATSMLNVPYSWTGSWVFTSGSQGMWKPQRFVFMPRVGLAWRLGDKSALRFGFARYVIPSELVLQGTPYGGYQDLTFIQPPYPGFDCSQTPLPLANGVPQATVSNPFPANNPLVCNTGDVTKAATGLGASNIAYGNSNFTRAVNDRFNLNLSHELPNHFIVEIAGFMNRGHNYNYTWNVNQVDPRIALQYKGATSVTVANPFYQYLTPAQFPGQLRNLSTVPITQLLVQRPQYGNMYEGFRNDPNNSDQYYSLDLKLQRSFANGFNFLAAYTYNREKSIFLTPSNAEGSVYFLNTLDNYNDALHLIDSPDPHHRATIAGTYQLPFGKGRHFLTNVPRPVDMLLGGWQMIGSWYFNSGPILQFPAAQASCDPTISNPTPQRWFNTSCFTVLPAYTLRENPLEYPGIHGPIYWEMQGGLSKQFQIKERLRFELKGNAYNLTNRLNLASPDVTSVTSATFGQALHEAANLYGRQIELGGKLLW